MNLIIIPRDPLIVRDGRPFSAAPGARAQSLPFPMPQTIAGAIRYQAGLSRQYTFAGTTAGEEIRALLDISIRGPVLTEFSGERWTLLFPSPADALYYEIDGVQRLVPLQPSSAGPGEKTNLPDGLKLLMPPGRSLPPAAKTARPPRFWTEQAFSSWITEQEAVPRRLGHDGPVRESRIHIQMDTETGVSADEQLFQTAGLEFTAGSEDGRWDSATPLGLWVQVDGEELPPGFRPLGGERRLTFWEGGGPPPPSPPPPLAAKLKNSRRARIIFITPAIFADGFMPAAGAFCGAPVEAAAVPRHGVVSGWDLSRGRPKPTRRLVPAGSVYFVSFPEQWSDGDIESWMRAMWWNSQADDEQDRRDGYGLAVVGAVQ